MGRRERAASAVASACLGLALVSVAAPACAQSVAARPAPGPRPVLPGAVQIAGALREGDARARQGRHAYALFAYERALELDPDNAQAHDGCGRQLIALGLPDDAVVHFQRAALLESHDAERWALLGDACRTATDWRCAASAYLTALRLAPNARAARGYDILGGGAFERAYAADADERDAQQFHPARVGGPGFALGVGPDHAGYGVQLSWYFVLGDPRLALSPYAAAGTISGDVLDVAAGAYAMWGEIDRWVMHLGLGAMERFAFQLYGQRVATRTVYGTTLSLGRQWNYSQGMFARALIGVSFPVDAYRDFSDDAELALSLAIGFKP